MLDKYGTLLPESGFPTVTLDIEFREKEIRGTARSTKDQEEEGEEEDG